MNIKLEEQIKQLQSTLLEKDKEIERLRGAKKEVTKDLDRYIEICKEQGDKIQDKDQLIAELEERCDSLQKAHNYNIDKIAELEHSQAKVGKENILWILDKYIPDYMYTGGYGIYKRDRDKDKLAQAILDMLEKH